MSFRRSIDGGGGRVLFPLAEAGKCSWSEGGRGTLSGVSKGLCSWPFKPRWCLSYSRNTFALWGFSNVPLVQLCLLVWYLALLVTSKETTKMQTLFLSSEPLNLLKEVKPGDAGEVMCRFSVPTVKRNCSGQIHPALSQFLADFLGKFSPICQIIAREAGELILKGGSALAPHLCCFAPPSMRNLQHQF